ncbi:MAG: hypothetical protein KY464_17785 [Gemmatimonadetes bacterium]|nr:hypothetical protein [Gemmatimonadota bacterium]
MPSSRHRYTCESDSRCFAASAAAFCRSIIIDEHGDRQSFVSLEQRTPGILDRWIERIGVKNTIMFPSIVARRKSYEAVGGFHPELIHTSDWDMWKRLAVHGPVWYEPEALALYREHSGSDTSRLMSTGANVADGRRAIEIARFYLPEDLAAEISRRSRRHYAMNFVETARGMLASGHTAGALAQARQALKCDRSPKVAGTIAYHLIWAGGRWAVRLLTPKVRPVRRNP